MHKHEKTALNKLQVTHRREREREITCSDLTETQTQQPNYKPKTATSKQSQTKPQIQELSKKARTPRKPRWIKPKISKMGG